jgi:hypothetical protein
MLFYGILEEELRVRRESLKLIFRNHPFKVKLLNRMETESITIFKVNL